MISRSCACDCCKSPLGPRQGASSSHKPCARHCCKPRLGSRPGISFKQKYLLGGRRPPAGSGGAGTPAARCCLVYTVNRNQIAQAQYVIYSTQYAIHRRYTAQYVLHCFLYTVCYALCIVHIVYCILCTAYCTLYIVYCALCTVHWILYTARSALCKVHFIP